VLNRYSKLKLPLVHMGYPFLAETKAILYVYPQVYAVALHTGLGDPVLNSRKSLNLLNRDMII